MSETSYPAFAKVPRLDKPVVLTEKIDGTNGLIFIEAVAPQDGASRLSALARFPVDNEDYYIHAGSRNRWITPNADNAGFAAWVKRNAAELVKLGVGHHYGEWWGSGIQRGYGLTNGEKRFSLFNVHRWGDINVRPACCEVVPILSRGTGSQLNSLVTEALLDLSAFGSQAAPGFERPEGVVVFHEGSGNLYKVTLDGDTKASVGVVPMAREPANMLKPPGLEALELVAA